MHCASPVPPYDSSTGSPTAPQQQSSNSCSAHCSTTRIDSVAHFNASWPACALLAAAFTASSTRSKKPSDWSSSTASSIAPRLTGHADRIRSVLLGVGGWSRSAVPGEVQRTTAPTNPSALNWPRRRRSSATFRGSPDALRTSPAIDEGRSGFAGLRAPPRIPLARLGSEAPHSRDGVASRSSGASSSGGALSYA